MEQPEGLRAWFPRPRSVHEIGLLGAVIALGMFQYADRAELLYLQYWCNLVIMSWIALSLLLYLVLRRIIKHQALYALVLVAVLLLARHLPLPARPDVRAFARHQEDYARLLSLAAGGQLVEDTDLIEEMEAEGTSVDGSVLAVPSEFDALHLTNLVVEQESPRVVGFASRRYLATVYYLETADAVETLRDRIESSGYALEPLADQWWLVWQPD